MSELPQILGSAPRAARPWRRSVDLRLTPAQVARRYHRREGFAFLDSSEPGQHQARWSVLGWEPPWTFVARDGAVQLSAQGTPVVTERCDPLAALGRVLGPDRGAGHAPARLPYCGGALGYLGFELYRWVERYGPHQAQAALALPDLVCGLHDWLLVYDHLQGHWELRGDASFELPAGAPSTAQRLASLEAELRSGDDDPGALVPTVERVTGQPGPLLRQTARQRQQRAAGARLPTNFTRATYEQAVERALEHIRAGDIYQVNLSQRFRVPLPAPPFLLFELLRELNPCRYGAYLSCGDHVVLSASPELFLRRSGLAVETRPIKGTRRRGRSAEEDRALRDALLRSPKDAAELSMVVDLERNDLGRVCRPGSVQVRDHRAVLELPTVLHTVSTVQGELRPGTSAETLLRATFPGGSITGCPKIRAIEIIDALEPTRRGAYTGAIGWLGAGGDMVLNVAIRTAICTAEELTFQVGGGIVADSDPAAEYQETLDKAAAFFAVLDAAAHREAP